MDNYEIGILEGNNFSKQALKVLFKIGNIQFYDKKNSLKDFVVNKDIIFVRLGYLITDDIVEKSKVKIICSPTTGLNHIKLITKKIKIISLQGETSFLNSIRATAEHILGLSIALLRNYKSSFSSKALLEWNREMFIGHELMGNTVGIIGLGRIGKILSKYYQILGSEVRYFDVEKNKNDSEKNTYGIKEKNLNNLLKHSKIIILSVNYTEKNDKIFDKSFFKQLDNKFFINASRGEVINEDDLLQFIKRKRFKGVALDVLSNETNSIDFRKTLAENDFGNIIITPHIGGMTYESINKTEEFITRKLLSIL